MRPLVYRDKLTPAAEGRRAKAWVVSYRQGPLVALERFHEERQARSFARKVAADSTATRF